MSDHISKPDMDMYIGTKIISAIPMNRKDYNKYRGWDMPANENGYDQGYLVEYHDTNSVHPNHLGYISWSPKETFEEAYKMSGFMNFGHALEALKNGQKVARTGWNGKNMWIALTPGKTIAPDKSKFHSALNYRSAEILNEPITTADVKSITIHPRIDMRTADGSICVGWLASQTDMLAEDWCIVK